MTYTDYVNACRRAGQVPVSPAEARQLLDTCLRRFPRLLPFQRAALEETRRATPLVK